MSSSDAAYSEAVRSEASPDAGLLFITMVAMPHKEPVEFDVTEASALANRINAAVALVEASCVGKSAAPPEADGPN